MSKAVSISEAVAWPFLLPGNLACSTLGLDTRADLVRPLVNLLFWSVFGVIIVAVAV
jgi:hypothetical protein